LRDAIRETIACFPVYRTYIDERGEISERDARFIEFAARSARRRNAGTARSVFDFLQSSLLLSGRDKTRLLQLQFTLKFQQLTGPVMAKGLEDTVCYTYNRFIACNEVGGSPDVFGVSLDEFHRAVNRVEKSFTRVEADEVTYNLHVVLRYELELELLRGQLPVADLPEAWNAKMKALLGIVPPNPTLGVLQDIHWAWGEFGYFPTYALGNLYGASLFAAAKRQLPGLEEAIGRGELLRLRDWLRERIHREGFRYFAEELVTKVTGKGLTDEDFIAYLRAKYSALYEVTL
jgi:hypothetical protein